MMTAWKAKAKAAVRAGRECRARRAPRAARRAPPCSIRWRPRNFELIFNFSFLIFDLRDVKYRIIQYSIGFHQADGLYNVGYGGLPVHHNPVDGICICTDHCTDAPILGFRGLCISHPQGRRVMVKWEPPHIPGYYRPSQPTNTVLVPYIEIQNF